MSSIKEKLKNELAQYGQSHRHPMNHRTHAFGIPLIVFSLIGLLSQVEFGGVFSRVTLPGPLHWDLGLVLVLGSLLYYLFLDWRVGLSISLINLGIYSIARVVPWGAHIAIFVFGWGLQALGHYRYEKNSPAFFTHIRHLWIGPLWVYVRMLRIG